MYGLSSESATSTLRVPVNDGVGRSSNRTTCLFARAASSGSSGLRSRSACCSRSRSWSSRFSTSRSAFRSPPSRPQTTPTTARGAGAGEEVDRRLRVLGRDPHGGVLLRGGGAADEQRQVEVAALHLTRHVDHL